MATHGVLYRDVVARWGEPEAFAAQAPDPVYCLYGDLELGFTSKGRLWHMEIDHGRRVLSLPSAPGKYVRERLPRIPRLVRDLAADGYQVTECVPREVDPDEVWLRVEHSGVLFRRDAELRVLRFHSTAMRICQEDEGCAAR
ncbi:hypothetical protein [Streptomyces chrestomyceticus]|uniref:hypothetical protein n=1 Tax=Streptomyces chrestomyceticus TaxID=68185 RepID=UPI0019D280D0|nr:hypothetical protein [Streptomyces chrestomyceticus]